MKEVKNKRVQKSLSDHEKKSKDKIVKIAQSDKSYSEVLDYIGTEIERSKQNHSFSYRVKCFRSDGVYQLHRAIDEIIGYSSVKDQKGPSGGDQAISTIDVTLSSGERIKVPYGTIDLPDMGEDAHLDIGYDITNNNLVIKGQCQFRFSEIIDNIVSRTKELISTDSIYKGVALEVTNVYDPIALDLSHIDNERMVLSDDVNSQLNSIYARILNPEICERNGIPLKYGCLFEGPYGTGKTLLAFKIGRMAIQNNWSFIYLKDPKNLEKVLLIVKQMDKSGRGAVVFVEDLDQIAKGSRDKEMQGILNTLDGGDTKDMNVITLFTTNHIEQIEPTFLRGKRIGSVISLGSLDAPTAKVFIEESFEGTDYTLEENLDKVYELIANSSIVPAFMAEIIEKIKADMIFRNGETMITSKYLELAVKSYITQMNLSRTKSNLTSPADRLATALREVMEVESSFKINSIQNGIAFEENERNVEMVEELNSTMNQFRSNPLHKG